MGTVGSEGKTMLKEKCGFVLMALGISTANSEWLIVPMAFMALGIWLMRGLIEW